MPRHPVPHLFVPSDVVVLSCSKHYQWLVTREAVSIFDVFLRLADSFRRYHVQFSLSITASRRRLGVRCKESKISSFYYILFSFSTSIILDALFKYKVNLSYVVDHAWGKPGY